MNNKHQAKQIAQEHINKHLLRMNIIIIDEDTIEKEYGWVFFYQSKEFVETGDFSYKLAGNGPIIVEKTGNLHQLSAAKAPISAITDFETTHSLN